MGFLCFTELNHLLRKLFLRMKFNLKYGFHVQLEPLTAFTRPKGRQTTYGLLLHLPMHAQTKETQHIKCKLQQLLPFSSQETKFHFFTKQMCGF